MRASPGATFSRSPPEQIISINHSLAEPKLLADLRSSQMAGSSSSRPPLLQSRSPPKTHWPRVAPGPRSGPSSTTPVKQRSRRGFDPPFQRWILQGQTQVELGREADRRDGWHKHHPGRGYGGRGGHDDRCADRRRPRGSSTADKEVTRRASIAFTPSGPTSFGPCRRRLSPPAELRLACLAGAAVRRPHRPRRARNRQRQPPDRRSERRAGKCSSAAYSATSTSR